MIESPLLDELKREWTAETCINALREANHKAVIRVLESRLGEVPDDIKLSLQSIPSEERLSDLIRLAARCATLADFRHELTK